MKIVYDGNIGTYVFFVYFISLKGDDIPNNCLGFCSSYYDPDPKAFFHYFLGFNDFCEQGNTELIKIWKTL